MMIKALLIQLATLLFAVGCTTASSTFSKKATHLNYQISEIQGLGFRHTFFENNLSNGKSVLHVYLGGDGTPWFKGRYIVRDPTPLKPVNLSLMKMDNVPAIYLGRPCYHQRTIPRNCNKSLWTNERFSQVVVDSMVAVLKRYIQQHNFHQVRLFGFSGGGTLAMLMAAHIQEVSHVVTIAGNLDIDAWTAYHGYLPLSGSLNPAKQAPLPLRIRQLHLVGLLDSNVPAELVKSEILRQKAQYVYVEQADHHCCWESVWMSILLSLN